jgi:predicted ABC-type ATPase
LRPPCFHLLAGPNGAGKSTLYKALTADGIVPTVCEFVNADLYERSHLGHITDPQARSQSARLWADTRREQLLARGQSFVSETVFSHPSKLQLIANAQQAGFVVALYVVALDDPQRLLARVDKRMREGGHSVPSDKILARYPRTMAHLQQAVQLADAAYLFDSQDVAQEIEDGNEQTTGGQHLVAICENGRLAHQLTPSLPRWAHTVLGSN